MASSLAEEHSWNSGKLDNSWKKKESPVRCMKNKTQHGEEVISLMEEHRLGTVNQFKI